MLLHVHGHLSWVHWPLHVHVLRHRRNRIYLLLLLLYRRLMLRLWYRCALFLVFSNNLYICDASALDRPLRPSRTSDWEEDVFERQSTSRDFSYSAMQDSVGRLFESDLDSRASEVSHA
jgi:hypothetical protein